MTWYDDGGNKPPHEPLSKDQQIQRLKADNEILRALLELAMSELPTPPKGRQPGEPVDWRYAGERPVKRLLRAIDGGA